MQHLVSRRALLARAAALPLAGLTAATGLAALAACTRGEPGEGATPPPDPVTYLTNFGTLGRDAYAWVALDRGFFAEAGLDVTIQPGTGTNPNLAALLGGHAHFAAVDLAGAVIAAGNEVAGFSIIAAVQQRNLSAIMTIDPAITDPRDLEGRTVGLPPGAVTQLLFPVYAELAGIDAGRVAQVALEAPELVGALVAGRVDAIGQFVVGEPLVAAAADGREVTVLPYDRYVGDLYGVTLLTSTGLAEQDPDLCRRFRDALLRGLAYALDHPRDAGEVLARHVETADPEVAAAELTLMAPYALGDSSTPLGGLDPARVARSIAILQAAGAVPSGLTPQRLVAFDLVPTRP